MVEIVSDTKSVRTIRRISEAFRLHLPYYFRQQGRTQPGESGSEQELESGETAHVRLEVQEDRNAATIVYRLVDLGNGALIGEWHAEQLAELREFLRKNHIRLIDRRI